MLSDPTPEALRGYLQRRVLLRSELDQPADIFAGLGDIHRTLAEQMGQAISLRNNTEYCADTLRIKRLRALTNTSGDRYHRDPRRFCCFGNAKGRFPERCLMINSAFTRETVISTDQFLV